MKATGIVRNVDSLGRVVIPIELRRKLGIEVQDSMEIFMDGDLIILKNYQPLCIFCGKDKGLKRVFGKNVCEECVEELKQI